MKNRSIFLLLVLSITSTAFAKLPKYCSMSYRNINTGELKYRPSGCLEKGLREEEERKNQRFLRLVEKGSIKKIKEAVSNGASLNAFNYGVNAIMLAAKYRNSEIIKFLISSGADVNSGEKVIVDSDGDKRGGETALHYAALWNKKPSVMMELIKSGAKLETKAGYFQTTPLTNAVRNNTLPVVKALIDAGANYKTKDKYGENLIIKSAGNENIAVIDYIFKKLNEDINKKYDEHGKSDDKTTLLLKAAQWNKNGEAIDLILSLGAEINIKNKEGLTPLMLASSNDKNLGVVKILAKHTSNLNEVDKEGNTAFIHSVASGADGTSYDGTIDEKGLENTKYLAELGVDTLVRNKNGFTALDYAYLINRGKETQRAIFLKKFMKENNLLKDHEPTIDIAWKSIELIDGLYGNCKNKEDEGFGQYNREITFMKKGKFNADKKYTPYKIEMYCEGTNGQRVFRNLATKVFYSEDFSEWSAKLIE